MKNITPKILREFGIILGLGIPLIIGLFIPFLIGHSFRLWTIWLGIIFLVPAILRPKLLLLPYKGWMTFGNILSSFNSRIIFGFVFLFILIPISYIMRLMGHDPLRKKFTKDFSYREYRKNNKINFKKVF